MARHVKDEMADEKWQLDRGSTHESIERDEEKKTEYPSQVVRTSSREELMECIKRGQRPHWVPQSSFQALRDEEDAMVEQRRLRSTDRDKEADSCFVSVDPSAINETQQHGQKEELRLQIDPIERPRSALHRGNFADSDSAEVSDFWSDPTRQPGLAISTTSVDNSPPSWLADSPRLTAHDAMSHVRTLSQLNTTIAPRRRAPSLGSSLSSSFVMRTPTSPLVQATSHLDVDTRSHRQSLSHHVGSGENTSIRRRTMPPSSFTSFTMTPIEATPPNFSRPFAPALRREASLPLHGHATRRSLSSFTYQPRSNPQTPLAHSRRPSMTSEGGSRRRKSMIGSFEESILRGRMSTPPSKPLDFVAQIGVMGKGNCPASLKCPAHVSVPFPAVFYSYPSSSDHRSVSDDTPSPYVGTVDLNHNLKHITLATKKTKKDISSRDDMDHQNETATPATQSVPLDASKLHVGGAYRIPQQGQLQIIIKNPNKTAVKLFLVPYDLTGMEAGTKTFVRQRSYSSGPVVENVVGNKQVVVDPLENKHILRYLVHIRFCCPAKNRYYLYDNIRVVFANRVPDGKEKLENEVQLPDPKFSTWKPSKSDPVTEALKNTPTTLVGSAFEVDSPQFFGDMDDFVPSAIPASPTPAEKPAGRRRSPPPFEFPTTSIQNKQKPRNIVNDNSFHEPFQNPFEILISRPQTPSNTNKPERALSPVTGFGTTTPIRSSPILWRSPPSGGGSIRSFSPIPPEVGDGLLSRQFKELGGQQGQQKAAR
ncbi:hypothetical protein LTS08_004220 [Lithohypha guttulata]|nr:hypothetical protein LTS08_004220 [Lithohypha guttulata]